MKVCVTGATGFVGAHVVAALTRGDGGKAVEDVRVTVRDPSRLEALAGLPVESVRADILDRKALRRALAGCDLLFHTAGLVASRPERLVWRVNAVAPRLVIEAAAEAGVRRVVLTSSVAAIGRASARRPANERQRFPPDGFGLVYPDSKREGELAAFDAGDRLDVEVVTVNPAYVLGVPVNRSLPPETSARIVSNYLRGRLPAIVDSWTNVVDVEDVAAGHLLAAGKGKPGERYILGGQNLRWSEVIERVAKLSGRRHPVVALPPELERWAKVAARIGVPGLPLEAIRLMAPDWRYSSAKAKRELGYDPRSAGETLARTVDWCLELIENGAAGRSRRHSFDFVAAGVRTGDRLGLLGPLKLAGRLVGRRTVL